MIRMLQSLDKVRFLVGSPQVIEEMATAPAKEPFNDEILDFLNDISKMLMKDPRSRAFSDVVTLGFWLRKGSTATTTAGILRSCIVNMRGL